MGIFSKSAGCVAGATKYGVAAGSVSGTGGALIGGLYGCFLSPDKKAGREFEAQVGELIAWWERQERTGRRLHRKSRNLIRDVQEFFGGSKKPKKKATKPGMEKALGLMIHHLDKRGGSSTGKDPYQFELQGTNKKWYRLHASYVLSQSNKVHLYGTTAAGWDAQKLYHHIAVMFAKTSPEWSPAVRWSMAHKRVGDFLVDGGTHGVIEKWPLFDQKLVDDGLRDQRLKELDPDYKDHSYEQTTAESRGNWGSMMAVGGVLVSLTVLLFGLASPNPTNVTRRKSEKEEVPA